MATNTSERVTWYAKLTTLLDGEWNRKLINHYSILSAGETVFPFCFSIISVSFLIQKRIGTFFSWLFTSLFSHRHKHTQTDWDVSIFLRIKCFLIDWHQAPAPFFSSLRAKWITALKATNTSTVVIIELIEFFNRPAAVSLFNFFLFTHSWPCTWRFVDTRATWTAALTDYFRTVEDSNYHVTFFFRLFPPFAFFFP